MATKGRKRTFTKNNESRLEDDMELILRSMKLDFYRNYNQCIPGRKLQADFYLDRYKIIIEIQGGTWIGFNKNSKKTGWHQHPIGYKNDCDKGNLFTIYGYHSLYFTSDHFKDIKEIISDITRLINRVVNKEENAKQLALAE